MRNGFPIAALFALAGCAAAKPGSTSTIGDDAAPPPPAGHEYRVFRPAGPGPHPAVVFLSGCSGFTPAFAPKAYVRPAEQLRDRGFVVVWVDYLGRRDLRSCATGGVTQPEAARDAAVAAAWLRSLPYVDGKRISALGWSFGGGAVLASLVTGTAERVFTRAIVYYPYCTPDVKPLSGDIPLLVLRGGSDDVAPAQLCERAFGSAAGNPGVKVVDYAEARHAFDMSELPPKLQYAHGTLGYHPQAAAAAWQEVQRFLER
jgi:dienelactone hydrolase